MRSTQTLPWHSTWIALVASLVCGDSNPRPFAGLELPLGTKLHLARELDADGHVDLVVGGAESVFNVYRGKGDGSFHAGLFHSFAVIEVEAAYVDADDHLDLVGITTGGTVRVLRGLGTGTFVQHSQVDISSPSRDLVLGDLNRDGEIDAVVSHTDAMELALLLGAGDGTFPTHSLLPVPGVPGPVLVGDWNEDGEPDLVVAHTGATPNYGDRLWVYAGDGSGGFALASEHEVGVQPVALLAVDWTSDGHGDLFSANDSGHSVSFLAATGEGSFAPEVRLAPGERPLDLAAGDLGADGSLDLLVAFQGLGGVSGGGISRFSGDGAGGFGSPSSITLGPSGVRNLDLADFDEDDLVDVAGGTFAKMAIRILFGDPDTGVALAKASPAGPEFPRGFAIGDVNGDHEIDVAVAAAEAEGFAAIRFGLGMGSYGAGPVLSLGVVAGAMLLRDLSGDGNADLLVAVPAANNVRRFLGDGAGGFGSVLLLVTGSSPRAMLVLDLEGNGNPDLLVANHGANTVTWYLGSGGGSFFAPGASVVGSAPVALASGDVSQDGIDDVVVANELDAGTLRLLKGNGTGGFFAPVVFTTGPKPRGVALGDLDLDGRLDVANSNSNHAADIHFGTRTGGFGPSHGYPTGFLPRAIAIADADADGIPDVLVVNTDPASSQLAFLRGAGGVVLEPARRFDAGLKPLGLALADLDAEGRLDGLLVAEGAPDVPGSQRISVLLNRIAPPPGVSAFGTGTPGCDGSQGMTALQPAPAGGIPIDVTCSNAPPSSAGILLLCNEPDVAGSDPWGLSLVVHVDLLSASWLQAIPITSDAQGVGRVPIAIPGSAHSVGSSWHLQSFWSWGPCLGGRRPLSSSRGLTVVLQAP